MKIGLVTPAPPESRQGNRVTAQRWAGKLEQLGHTVDILEEYRQGDLDLLIALHAIKSHASARRFHDAHPARPVVVALTGTDVYGPLRQDSRALDSLALARRLIVLQPLAIAELPEEYRPRARVIYQSVEPPANPGAPPADCFRVCVVGHLRAVKDPFRTAQATQLLPASSRIQVVHLGSALDEDMALQARREMASNPRYHWAGEATREQALRMLTESHLLSLTSISEGGANAVSEAVVCGTSVVSSRIPGTLGLLGEDYPGYFPVGDTRALAELLWRAETDGAFLAELRRRGEAVRPLFDPARELQSWQNLLAEL